MKITVISETAITPELEYQIVQILEESNCPHESLINTFEDLDCRGIIGDAIVFGECPNYEEEIEY